MPFIDIPTPGAGEVREEQPQAGNTVTIIMILLSIRSLSYDNNRGNLNDLGLPHPYPYIY
jgi:hypothetical protein